MALTPAQRKQLEELQALENEPEGPTPNINISIDLSNDTAWTRAKGMGWVRDPEPDKPDDEKPADDAPRRRGRGERYFGGEQ